MKIESLLLAGIIRWPRRLTVRTSIFLRTSIFSVCSHFHFFYALPFFQYALLIFLLTLPIFMYALLIFLYALPFFLYALPFFLRTSKFFVRTSSFPVHNPEIIIRTSLIFVRSSKVALIHLLSNFYVVWKLHSMVVIQVLKMETRPRARI